jgi:hypothetical protein
MANGETKNLTFHSKIQNFKWDLCKKYIKKCFCRKTALLIEGPEK